VLHLLAIGFLDQCGVIHGNTHSAAQALRKTLKFLLDKCFMWCS